ncbi:hypothetical protein Clacol_005323 [Clathrus columnatus]|uniref:Uncharacterized protein n=1 Tax=Clathrus columnatus TaxID=1419009 RepID=A0AAV5ABM5_9AGAM|nr:hypothetical protein Clacol_005323 [Clathrus columnatus]
MPAMSHTPVSPKRTTAPAPKPSSSHKRTIDLIEEDELELDVEIVPPKKAKFIPPTPKEPVFSMGNVIEDGCVSCTNKNKDCVFAGSGDAGNVEKEGKGDHVEED